MNPNTLPVRLVSNVVPGFGRGSKELGIPTANLCKEKLQCKISFDELPCGIYWGFARIVDTNTRSDDNNNDNSENKKSDENISLSPNIKNQVYKTAVSIGFNPVYKNKEKTIEPHLIASSNDPLRISSKCQETQLQDLYGYGIRLSIVGYLRPELPFEGLDKLIEAIKNDIVQAETLAGNLEDSGTLDELKWVESDHDC